MLCNGPYTPLKVPIPVKASAPPSHTWFIGSTQLSIPNVFAQVKPEGPYTLQWAAPFPLKLPIPMEDVNPSYMWFLGSTRVHSPHVISIGSAIFAGLTTVIDRPTD